MTTVNIHQSLSSNKTVNRNPEERPFRRPICSWKHNIKINLTQTECEDAV